MIRFCPTPQGENPRSETPKVPESSTSPLNPQQMVSPAAAHSENLMATPIEVPPTEVSPTPILVPFADISTSSPSGSPNVSRIRTRDSKKRRTLILNDDEESD